ncbi:MAG: sigma-70 family RNA polymerase sigma factor [Bacillota bacterium]
MQDQQLQNLLEKARAGDEKVRDDLLQSHRAYIAEVAAAYCGRRLYWQNDDELSVSLLAFNEAIDTFNPSAGKEFLHYARLVIKNRLVDYFRKESRHRHLSLEGLPGDEEGLPHWEAASAWRQYHEEELARERAEEMLRFDQVLHTFDLSLYLLERACPRHRDTREMLVQAACVLAREQDMLAYVKRYKQLPLQELSQATRLSRKVLKRGRAYILALTLILTVPEFTHLRSLFSLPPPAACSAGPTDTSITPAGSSRGGDPR